MPTSPPPPREVEGPVYIDATLTPHRSLSPAGLLVVMAVFVTCATAIGLYYFSIGAWPIPGFLGLDIFLVWLAFRQSNRQRRQSEHVRVTADRFDIARRSQSGRVRHWCLSPHWARVRMDDPPEHESHIEVTSHGRVLVLGRFLAPSERAEFAGALGEALDAARAERWGG